MRMRALFIAGVAALAPAAAVPAFAHHSYAEFDTAQEPLELTPLLEAAKPLVLNTQLGKLADVLRWPREDRECPDRNY